MSTRNIMWTTLPNGFNTAGDHLRLSVYISPRLITNNGVDGTLAEFPDLLDWPSTLGPLQYSVQIQGGPSFTVMRDATIPLQSALWTALFKNTTFVRSFQPEDNTALNVRSYPVRKVLSFVKQTYQAVGVQSPTQPPTRGEYNFEDSPRTITNLVPLALVSPDEVAAVRGRIDGILKSAHAIPPQFGDTAEDFFQVETFHDFLSKRLPDGTPAPLQPQTLPKLDFHQVVSRLSQYPELMRRMGLVVDLEIPTAIPAAGNIRVVANLPAPAPLTPWTTYQVDGANKGFVPGPGSEVANGMLLLTTNNYDVVEIDVDGAARKLLNFAFTLGLLDSVNRTPGSPKRFGLPSTRSAGFMAARQGRALQLYSRFTTAVAQNKTLTTPAGTVLTSDDVTRGYRIDVFDSMTNQWHSLCFRKGTYHFLDPDQTRQIGPDEGFVSLATTQSADGTNTTDLRLPEGLFRWAGWSLSVPRIGKTVGSDGTPADPQNPAQTDFKLEVSFKSVKGTLPRLRFGGSYQFRARAVDLAGNSLPLDATIPATFSIPAQPLTYLRYEPVVSPAVVLRQSLSPDTTPGESVQTLAIRSNFNTPFAGPSERHLAPPKVSEEMAEVHGMFDTPAGLDKTVYNTLVNKDGDFGVDPAHPDQPVPHPEAQLVLPYLPDPLATGAAFQNLPGTTAVFQVDYASSGTWPNVRPFRISLVEGSAAPVLAENATERVLTVSLAKAERVNVLLSCYVSSDGLAKLALWEWFLETNLNPANLGPLQQFALNGVHWMLTPPKTLTLVHAVQQPVIEPQFQTLASGRVLGDTKAHLTDEIPISGKSTVKVDINATWQDTIDDGSNDPRPKTLTGQAQAFDLPVTPEATVLSIDGLHEFHDTKYRKVSYTAVATSRFREFFPNSLTRPASDFTRSSVPVTLDILNTARPDAPKVLYVLPTFGWGQNTEGVWSISTRGGGGLRVYLDRPWFSSGEGELLGVVLWGCAPPPHNTFSAFTVPDFLKPYVTQWGIDPIWSAPALPSQAVPLPDHFLNPVAKETELTLEELANNPGIPISVAGHPVGYDNDRKLWFCDIELDPGVAYFPFIRLALARFQPKSLPDAHLSRVVLADFAQLVPGRSASIAFDGFDPTLLELAVTGLTHNQLSQSLVQVTVEMQPKGAPPDSAWVPAFTVSLPATKGPGATTLWTSAITLPAPRTSQPFRLRIEEFEIYQTGTAGQTQNRLVYADVLGL